MLEKVGWIAVVRGDDGERTSTLTAEGARHCTVDKTTANIGYRFGDLIRWELGTVTSPAPGTVPDRDQKEITVTYTYRWALAPNGATLNAAGWGFDDGWRTMTATFERSAKGWTFKVPEQHDHGSHPIVL